MRLITGALVIIFMTASRANEAEGQILGRVASLARNLTSSLSRDSSLNLADLNDPISGVSTNRLVFNTLKDMASQHLEETFSLSKMRKNREKKQMKEYFDKEKPFFALYTRDNWNTSFPVVWDDTRNWAVTPFNPVNPIKFIIPGKYSERSEELKNSILYHCECNVLVVGWWPEVDRLMEAAKTMADLILSWKTRAWIVLENIHLIGHGLGAHLAGMVGMKVRQKMDGKEQLGRITGLDPSRDILETYKSSEYLLDFSDALFVDVIHSDFQNWNSIGLEQPLGHLDFYSNLGNPQPGCYINPIYFVLSLDKKGKKVLTRVHKSQEKYGYSSTLVCSHQRAFELFMESLVNPTCSFIGVKCPDFNLLLTGICHCKASMDACAIMGINADKNQFLHILRHTKAPLIQGRWYVPTSAGKHVPYCSPNPGSLMVAENLDVEKDFDQDDKTPS